MTALHAQIALVDQTGTLDLAKIAGAVNQQIADDFAPHWPVRASVVADANPAPGTWRVIVQNTLDDPGALGYHTDEHNQPVAYVELTNDTSTTISHETLEMLADPFGNRMREARLPQGLEKKYAEFGLPHPASYVHYLVEVCDPPEARSYAVGGVLVSDFVLPIWYRSNATMTAYSQAGACSAPREVADGGYVSFANSTGEWYQAFAEGAQLQVQALGRYSKSDFASLRQFTDHHARLYRARAT